MNASEMAIQLREAARELELPGDYSEAAFIRVRAVHEQLERSFEPAPLPATGGT